ncbi:hypothetical protein C0J52_05360 [Blattella germanica]|nr:hypothetical protein C0J52_05360 [Blattella germanica]
MATPCFLLMGLRLYCKICEVKVAAEKRFTVDQHVNREKHKRGLQAGERRMHKNDQMLLYLQSIFNKFTEDVLSKIPPLKNASALDFNWETPELLDLKNYMPTIIAFVSSVTQFKLVDMNHENALFSFFLVAAGILCSLDLEIKPFTVFIKSDIPTTICAGSTAAHSVCIAAAFVHYIRLMVMKTNNLKNNISKSNYKMSILSPFNLNVFHTREKDTVFKWSCLCEMLMPGNTRGIGSAICTYGYLLLFSKGESEFRPSLKLFVSVQKMDALIIDTGVRQDKNVMKKSLIMFKQHFPEVLESIMTIEKIICNIIVEMLAVSQTSVKKVEFGELEFGVSLHQISLYI